jgi:hypothetical protein
MPQAGKKQKKSLKPIQNNKFILKDSGKRVKLKSGAKRELVIGKGRYDLISPIVMRRLANIMECGSVKYGDRDWEKGIPLSVFIDKAQRHINQLKEGYYDEDHAAQALWNIHCFIHTQEMIERKLLPKELDNLPNYLPQDK